MIIRRILLAVTTIYLILIVFFTHQIHQLSQAHLPEKADAIIVVTGQAGRIEAGEMLLQQYTCPLFISGTGGRVKVEEIIKDLSLVSRIILGPFAKNTCENGQEIAEWIKKYTLHSIIVISHNYHLPRLLLHLRKIPNVTIYPYAVTAPLPTGRFFSEMHKYYYSLLI